MNACPAPENRPSPTDRLPGGRLVSTAVFAPLLLVLIVAGCSRPKDLPTTYEARGTVFTAEGGPMTGGLIEFRSLSESPFTTTGEIQEDGGFELTTLVESEKLAGAVAGSYQVTIMPPLPETQDVQAVAEPIVLPDRYEVKAEGENFFNIRLGDVR